MKTFKLKSLIICFQSDDRFIQQHIPLIDGLIIDREDEQQQWVIEAYVEKSYKNFFALLRDEQTKLLLQVKITKDTNDPAFFVCNMIGLNDIGEHMNALFKGTIIDQKDEQYREWMQNIEP